MREVSTLKHLQTTSSGSARFRSLPPDDALAGGGGGCGCGGGCEISPTLSPFLAIFSRFREIQLFISNKLFWAFFFFNLFLFWCFHRLCTLLLLVGFWKAGFFPFACCSRESVLRLNSVSFCKAIRWTRVGLLPWGHVSVYAFFGHFMSTVRHLAKFIFSWSFYPFLAFLLCVQTLQTRPCLNFLFFIYH